ncbi:MAG: hypothetical protein PHR35_09785 [Kiritimatiellae bacterium]|nr:hypothetical protein [Kiritimatiellia bacterium]
MKTAFMTVAGMAIITTITMACRADTNDLSKYVCTDRFFAVPESVNPLDLDQAKLLVTANPDRFESHLMLAGALIKTGRLQTALDEFRTVDELASEVHDPVVLSGLEYESMYAFVLFAVAEQRIKKDFNDLYTLRMLQQAIGMDHGKLHQEQLLSRCYLYAATTYLKRGAYDAAVHAAETGKGIAKDEGNAGNERLLGEIIVKASDLRAKRKGKKTPNQASDATSEPAPGADSSAHQR